ncbi:MAG TPA: phosphoribosylformylglycinamidine cyclo-ligase [Bacteriovoracaceae bacterium]|nr:phosphoribosylformylglycinamidine cyclo-ligase [Bacteriovoracaceae bacterium]
MNYKNAGVDVEKGDFFVEKIKRFIGDTYTDRVVSGVGGFAALFEMDEERYLAAGTDGVGTKILLAQELDFHVTIGQDLVAMCVNDVICTGARPLFFLDYLACGKLDLEVHGKIVEGIARACKEVKCALIGGETAEMPGVYETGVYDLAGFAVGEVYKKDLLTPQKVQAGDYLVGLASSGFHSNGYSLVRKLVGAQEIDLKKELLTPTRLYVNVVMRLLKQQSANVSGIAHITGGGFQNIPRINEELGYNITSLPGNDFRTGAMNEILGRSGLSQQELFETFNMGVGLVIACRDPELLLTGLTDERAMILGRVENTFKGLKLCPLTD